MFHSEEIDQILPALMKFRQQVVQPKKTEENPFFKSMYANLTEIMRVSEGPLEANGLLITHVPDMLENQMVLRTILFHRSGQWFQSIYQIKPTKDDPQGVGGAITYARRYAIQAMLGLAAEDDDGNYASGNKVKPKAQPAEKSNGRTQSEFVKIVKSNLYPKDTLQAVGAHVGKALSGSGLKGFDPGQWDEMYHAVEQYAQSPA